MQTDVSVIVVSYNTRDMLRNCLASVFRETRQAKLQVIVVDNNSSDDSCAMVQENFPHVTLIPNPNNRGFAAANNQALRQAIGRYCLLLNPDTIILDGAIDKCLSFADANPNVGGVGPEVLWPDGRHQSSVFRFPDLLTLAIVASGIQQVVPHPILNAGRYPRWDWSRPRDVDVIAGCFILVRAEVIAQIGLLDEEFFMYGEEVEWCWRMAKSGWRLVYLADARIIHIWGGSAGKKGPSPATLLAKRRGELLVLQKIRGSAVARIANAIMLLGSLARLPLWAYRDLRRGWPRRACGNGWLSILAFHIQGIVSPTWRQTN